MYNSTWFSDLDLFGNFWIWACVGDGSWGQIWILCLQTQIQPWKRFLRRFQKIGVAFTCENFGHIQTYCGWRSGFSMIDNPPQGELISLSLSCTVRIPFRIRIELVSCPDCSRRSWKSNTSVLRSYWNTSWNPTILERCLHCSVFCSFLAPCVHH